MTTYTEKEVQQWRERMRKQREKDEKIHKEWLEKVTSQWKTAEWDRFRKKLEKLSLKEVRFLADKTKMKFAIGNKNITDKEEFIWILDEADKAELISEYNKLIQEKRTKGHII